MTEKGKTGGRQSESKFGAHPNSISEQVHTPGFDPELRRKFYENMKRYKEDQAALEAWAADGFGSGLNTVDDTGD